MHLNAVRSETCDGLDNDCDTLIDDGVLTTFYRDADNDMHGLATMSVAACAAPGGYVTSNDDCNDTCATCYPGRAETCDGLDNDCNVVIDNGVLTTYVLDCDADGYVLASPTVVTACTTPARPPGCATTGTVWRAPSSGSRDCADQDARATPGVASFQTTAITGPRAAGTLPFDFDCSGAEDRERTSVALCLDATVAGWTTTPIPVCGASGTWDNCLATTTLVQRCR